jgi:hypothetical protein
MPKLQGENVCNYLKLVISFIGVPPNFGRAPQAAGQATAAKYTICCTHTSLRFDVAQSFLSFRLPESFASVMLSKTFHFR